MTNNTDKPRRRHAAPYGSESWSRDNEARRWQTWYGYTNVNTPRHRAA